LVPWRTLLLLLVFVVLFTTWFVLRAQRLEQEALDLLNKPFVEYKEVVRLLGPPTAIWPADITLGREPPYKPGSNFTQTWYVTLGNRDVCVDILFDGEGRQLKYHCSIDDDEVPPWRWLSNRFYDLGWTW
jgi:hypothetical protein